MPFLYFLISLVLFIVALPFLIVFSFKQKYKNSIFARFFLFKNPPFRDSGVWFHVCSLGEAKSIKMLHDKIDGVKNISVVTNTGYDEACKYANSVRFLPYELFLPFWITKQKVLVVFEAELWYMLFYIAKKRGIKTILINARISDNSYKSYLRFKWLYKKIFANIDKVFAQSQKDKIRLIELGAKSVQVVGNIKSATNVKITKNFIKPKEFLITLASTHQEEERLILENFKITTDMKIVVVPRHPERFDEVDKYLKDFCKKMDLSYHRFSQKSDFSSNVILVDKMGEMINIYAISDLVVLGGSFVKNTGGHNPLEVAHFGCKLISGREIFNQESLFELIDNYNLATIDELQNLIKNRDNLKPTSIKYRANIEPILKELE